MSERWGFTTKAIHGGKMPDTHKSVAPPIYQTATYYYDTAEEGARLGQEIPPAMYTLVGPTRPRARSKRKSPSWKGVRTRWPLRPEWRRCRAPC